MQVAEKAHCATIRSDLAQHGRLIGLGETADRLDDIAVLVQQLKIFAIEVEVRGIFAGKHRIGLRSRRDQDRVRGKRHARMLTPCAVIADPLHGECHAARAPSRGVDFDCKRRQAFREADALLERLLDFFVVQRVRRTVDQAPPIRDRYAAPVVQQVDDARRATLSCGLLTLDAQRGRMRNEFARDHDFVFAPCRLDDIAARLRAQLFVAREKFFDLHRIVSERLRRRVDCRQAAADYDNRQAQLHVRK